MKKLNRILAGPKICSITHVIAFCSLTWLFFILPYAPIDHLVQHQHLHVRDPIFWGGFLSECLGTLSVVTAFGIMSRLQGKVRFAAWGFTGKSTARYFLAGTSAVFLGYLLMLGLLRRYGWYKSDFTLLHPSGWFLLLSSYAAYFVLVSFAEELAFRGFIFQTLEKTWGTGAATFVSSLLFAVLHLANPEASIDPVAAFHTVIFTFFGGLVYCFAFVLARSLWLPIVLHFFWDFFHSLLYDDTNTTALFKATFYPERVYQVSLSLAILATVILGFLVLYRGQWQKYKQLDQSLSTGTAF